MIKQIIALMSSILFFASIGHAKKFNVEGEVDLENDFLESLDQEQREYLLEELAKAKKSRITYDNYSDYEAIDVDGQENDVQFASITTGPPRYQK